LKLSLIEDREVFKVCLEYWNRLVTGLFNEHPVSLFQPVEQKASRSALYTDVLSNLRVVLIDRMVKPEEVLVVEDENGEIVRESVKETDTIVLYKSMREVLVFLTNLDVVDTETVMTEKLARQIDGSEWSWGGLNRLCWSIGSVSGTMSEEAEKRFLVHVIRELLGLVEIKRGKDNKAVVAANIMYVVGQYPRFLKAHWKFMKTVVNKLFEFMHESHEGVQDMACDTFIKIAKKCRRQFVMVQPGESEPFIDDILSRMGSVLCDLNAHQVHVFYEAIGCMIESHPVEAEAHAWIGVLMLMPNQSWDAIIAAAVANSRILQDVDTLRSLVTILKTNSAALSSSGYSFVTAQVSRIFMDMLSVYRSVSESISSSIQSQGNSKSLVL
jgi:exportin-1